MSDYSVNLDSIECAKEGNDTLLIRGWMDVGEEDPVLQVRADHTPINATLTRVLRPDVIAAFPQGHFPREDVGYEIRIPQIGAVANIAQSLRVRICTEHEKLPVLQKDMQDLMKEYNDSSLNYLTEGCQLLISDISLSGWIINYGDSLKCTITDAAGKEYSHARIQFSERIDVCKDLGLSENQCRGFNAALSRYDVESEEVHFIMDNGRTQKDYVINMKAFDKENTLFHRITKRLDEPYKEQNRKVLKESGIRGFVDYIAEESMTFSEAYRRYARQHKAGPLDLQREKREKFDFAPTFSFVIPLYNTPRQFLKELIDSLRAQTYPHWEVCLADGSTDDSVGAYIQKHYGKDSRIIYRRLEENTGISGNTNAALDMATGDYIVFTDHDDTLEPDALYLAVKELNNYPDTDIIYTDEDLVSEKGQGLYPHFKPDYNQDYLHCINYICHLCIVSRRLYEEVGGLRSGFDGAQDFDFLLRCIEKTDKIRHIPKVLYHWRSSRESTAGNQSSKMYAVEAGKKALEEHYQRLGIEAEVEFTGTFIVYRTIYKVHGNPKVSILIPNKDHIDDLSRCVDSIYDKSSRKNFEIIIIENNSTETSAFEYYEKLKKDHDNIKIVTWQGEFNYSAINNFGARAADGDYLLLLNNDTEVITPDWMDRMLGYCQRDDVGIAGAKLYYEDRLVQHAGIVIGIGGFAGHVQTGYRDTFTGYLGRLATTQDISAVTGACMMVKKSLYDQLGGLDPEFAVALNDVDFCLRVREAGYLVVFTPDAELFHYESKSRGYEDTPEKQERFRREIGLFKDRHAAILESGDPYYNPNLTLKYGDCSLRRSTEN